MNTKIFDTLLEPTFLIDDQKKVHYCNEPAAIIADISARKMVRSQKPLDEIFKFNEAVAAFADLKSLQDSSPYQELRFTTENGKDGRIQITMQPFPDEAGPRYLVYFRDVTLEDTLQKKYRAEFAQKEGYIKELEQARAELEKYSKNLEHMVAERTAEVKDLNRLMKALLDSLHQGFCVFNIDGKVLEISSRACLETLECDPRGKMIWDVLKLENNRVDSFKKWMQTVFSEMLPFVDLAPLGPSAFAHTEKKEIKLEYFPLRNADGQMEGVVLVASDISNLVEAQRQAEIERSYAKMIISLVKNKRQVAGFLRDAEEILQGIQTELQKNQPQADLLFRYLHTLKGGAASFSVRTVAEQCHVGETLLAQWKTDPTPVRLDSLRRNAIEIPALFQDFLTENSEILGSREKLRERWIDFPVSDLVHFQREHFTQSPEKAQIFAEKFIMEPIGNFFNHYQEVVNNVASHEGKQLGPIQLHNSKLKVLPEAYEGLFATFIHAFRNAVDHGIESPDKREASGKKPEGTIAVHFDYKEINGSEKLRIVIKDDGAGINPERIRAKLFEKGVSTAKESDQQVIQHVFDSQLSTKEKVTDISGRGVGMDAILTAAKTLGGNAWVESELGKGTSLFVEVPFIRDTQAVTQKAA